MGNHKVKALAAYEAKGELKLTEILRRDVGKTDIEFDVLYCGICHSDLHSLHGDFGVDNFPLVPGHEIVGRVTKYGSEVKGFSVGDLVAVGCLVDSCGTCEACHDDQEQFCHSLSYSFNSVDRKSPEIGTTYGGFSASYVVDQKFALHMPPFDNLAAATPLLCAGITVYSPLKKWGVTSGKRVAILGAGGLGHVAVRFAKSMGAHVTVLTRSQSKSEDAIRLGADSGLVVSDTEQMKAVQGTFDLIIDTISASHDVMEYMSLLHYNGALVLVGLPSQPFVVPAAGVIFGNKALAGSNIGGIAETQEMLDFAYKHGVVCDVEVISPDYVNTAMTRLENSDVRYRFVIDMKELTD